MSTIRPDSRWRPFSVTKIHVRRRPPFDRSSFNGPISRPVDNMIGDANGIPRQTLQECQSECNLNGAILHMFGVDREPWPLSLITYCLDYVPRLHAHIAGYLAVELGAGVDL